MKNVNQIKQQNYGKWYLQPDKFNRKNIKFND